MRLESQKKLMKKLIGIGFVQAEQFGSIEALEIKCRSLEVQGAGLKLHFSFSPASLDRRRCSAGCNWLVALGAPVPTILCGPLSWRALLLRVVRGA